MASVGCLAEMGAVSLLVSGQALSPLRFVWSNGLVTSQPLLSGLPPQRLEYSVTLTDSRNCSASIGSIFTLASCSPLGQCFVCGEAVNFCCAQQGMAFVGCSTDGSRFCTRSVSCSNTTSCSRDDDCGLGFRCMVNTCCGTSVCSPIALACDSTKRQSEESSCLLPMSTSCK
jgi:hypothetical protein